MLKSKREQKKAQLEIFGKICCRMQEKKLKSFLDFVLFFFFTHVIRHRQVKPMETGGSESFVQNLDWNSMQIERDFRLSAPSSQTLRIRQLQSTKKWRRYRGSLGNNAKQDVCRGGRL